MNEWYSIGPINGVVLILCMLGGLLTVGHATLRMRRSAHVPLLPVIGAIAAPLLFTLYAVTMQYTAGMDAAANHPVLIARQTLMAATLSKAVTTQILGGGISAMIALGMIGLCLAHASLGERPRTGIALAAAGLTFCLTATALGSGAASGAWELAAIRALLVLLAGGATTAVLLSTHQRGPGAQIGPIAAITLPLFVAAIDAAACGWLSKGQFILIAAAEPAARQGILNLMVASIASLRLFSGVGLVLALLLAGLGPLASAYRSQPLVRSQVLVLMSSMLMAVCVVIWASNYLVPFVFQTP